MAEINQVVNRLNAQQQLQRVNRGNQFNELQPKMPEEPTPSFKEVLSNAFGQVDTLQKKSDEMVIDFSKGHVENIHDVMVAMEKANFGLQLTVEVRNKLLDAYKEVMNLRF